MLVLFLLLGSSWVGADHYDDDKNYDDYEDDWLDTDKTMDEYNNEIHRLDPEVPQTLLPSTEGALTRLIRETSQIREYYEDDWLIAERAGTASNGDQVGCNTLEKRDEKRLASFVDEVEALGSAIRKDIQSKNIGQLKFYASSDSGSLALLQWRLLKKVLDNGNSIDTTDRGVSWLLNNRDALETLLTSGDIRGDKYKRAVEIFVTLLEQDPLIKSNPLRLRLAVATAVTFSVPIPSTADRKVMIDGMQKYHDFMKWYKQGVLYKPFAEVTAWHLRYVVGSFQQSAELVWARDNVPATHASPKYIAWSGVKMVKYTPYNAAGTSVQAGAAFYYNKPITLKIMHEVGGVCGAIARFGTGMAQAHGVPSFMVGQPGHAAFAYYLDGKWKLGNDISGWDKSDTHSGTGFTWLRPAVYFQLMNEAQADLTNYRLSEKLRFASLLTQRRYKFLVLEEASNVCPQNFDVWHDMEDAINCPELDKSKAQNAVLPRLEALRGKAGDRYDTNVVVSNKMQITANPDSSNPSALVDNNSKTVWKSKSNNSWFKLNWKKICALSDITFYWADRARADNINVNCRMQAKNEGFFFAKGTPEEIQLNNVLVTNVQVSLKGGEHMLEGIEVRGVMYGVKDVLKMVVDEGLKVHEQVRAHIKNAIDEWNYND